MRRHLIRLLAILFLAGLIGCADSSRPPPGSETMPGVDHTKVRLAVRDYLVWTYSARYIQKLDLVYSKPEEADGKATALVVHAKYAFSHRDARKSETLKRGQERLRLQETSYGYRVLELKHSRVLDLNNL